MAKAKIDILLPYWGEFSLLKETVESVFNQTETNWQLTVIDDAYPSGEASEYFKVLKDKRVTYIRHKKNVGITKNFNFAIQAANSEYCIILGCDDILLPNYVKSALKNIGNADFYQPGVEIINDNGNAYSPLVDKIKKKLRPKKPGIYRGEKLAATLSAGNWLYFPSITWRTDVIKQYGFDTTHDNTQDVILELSMISDNKALFIDNEITFQYRRSANSFSSRRKTKDGGRFSEEKEIYLSFAKKFTELGWNKAALSAKIHATSRIHRLMSSIQSGTRL